MQFISQYAYFSNYRSSMAFGSILVLYPELCSLEDLVGKLISIWYNDTFSFIMISLLALLTQPFLDLENSTFTLIAGSPFLA